MSDRRPSKLHDPAKALEWWRAEGSKMAIVELYEAVTNPVAVVRRGVESGTIKGKVMRARDKAQADRMGQVEPGIYIVIGPVSDGGEDRP